MDRGSFGNHFLSQGMVMREFGRKPPQISFPWITWKHQWPPQCIMLVGTHEGQLWIVSSNLQHQQCLDTHYICWIGQGCQLKFQYHMKIFLSVLSGCGQVKKNSDRCCRPIRIYKVWRDFRLRQNIVEYLKSLRNEVAMRRSRVVHGKHGMAALMLALKEA